MVLTRDGEGPLKHVLRSSLLNTWTHKVGNKNGNLFQLKNTPYSSPIRYVFNRWFERKFSVVK